MKSLFLVIAFLFFSSTAWGGLWDDFIYGIMEGASEAMSPEGQARQQEQERAEREQQLLDQQQQQLSQAQLEQ